MADLEIHLTALDKCRTAIHKANGQYGDIRTENNPGKLAYDAHNNLVVNRPAVGADVFGELTHSQALATEATAVWSTLIREMDDAHRKLEGTERGLSDVEENIRKAHKATS